MWREIPLQEGKELSPDGNYLISFQGVEGEISIACKVRKIDKGPQTSFLGLEFRDMKQDHKATLSTYLDFLKKH